VRLLCIFFGAAVVSSASLTATTRGAEDANASNPQTMDSKEDRRKLDEFADAARLLPGPAGLPECIWLGHRAVSLIWRNDLDTAFRHLELYDRFGCPAGHIQETFRCVVRQGNIDPKSPESLSSRVHGCWINPQLAPTTASSDPAGKAAGTSSQ
jgi:hypothetical protein